MLRKWVVGLCFSFFMTALMAAPVTAIEDEELLEDKKLRQTVFELERSVAILQLSKASLDDYQIMSEKMAHMVSLESRVDFLNYVTFLLCIALLIVFFQLHRQQKRLLFFEQIKKEDVKTEA